MRESFNKFKKEFEELKKFTLRQVVASDLEDMDENAFKAMQSMLRLSDACFEITEAQISTLERMEQKLDELLLK